MGSCQGLEAGEGRRRVDYRRTWGSFLEVMEIFYKLNVMLVTQLYVFVKLHRNLYQKGKFYCV